MTAPLDLTRAVNDICEAYDISPTDLAQMTIRPQTIQLFVYRRNDDNAKYVDLDTGEPATYVLERPITVQSTAV